MSETRQGMRFAAVLNSTRRAAGLSYRQLAQASGISHSFLSHVEKGERRAPPAKAILELADALEADRLTFALAAIADRAGSDVATTMVAALQQGPVGRDVDPTAGGVLIEAGPPGAEAELADLTAHDDAVDELSHRLTFVDLQLDEGFMRLGISVAGSEPIVIFVSSSTDSDTPDDD